MNDFQVVTNRAGRDETVRRRAHGQAASPGDAAEIDRVREEIRRERGLHPGESEHGFARAPERAFVPKALKHLLNDGEAGDDLVEVDDGLEIERVSGSKSRDPNRSVDENHEPATSSV